jgi:glycosyltransferase involved in cell wall biosynthesis
MISLVTACMNREPHLRKSLPVWLALPGISEILVVDWANKQPLRSLTKLDPRIRVVRVEDEPRWVLSYAFNLGIARSTGSVILKCDADCLPHAAVADLRPGPGHFFAGHWQSGAKLGKPSVNGQCLFARSQFDAVNGYSEYIRTYGRDDADFYDRLAAAGFARREIPPTDLDFIPHSHEARMACQIDRVERGIEAWLSGNIVFNEMRNAFLARVRPWNRLCPRAPYRPVEEDGAWEVVRREKASELSVSPAAAATARLFALRYLVKVTPGPSPGNIAAMDEPECLRFLLERYGGKSNPALSAVPSAPALSVA